MTLPLDGPRIGPRAGGATRQLVVLLHGVGADGQDLIGLAEPWGAALPHAAFVAPDAPFPCDMAPMGRQWFSVEDRDPERLAAGVRAVAPAVEDFLAAELDRLGLPPAALAVMGFSQGAMTALFAGLRGRTTPATILAYAGALLAADSLGAELRGRPPVLLVHGEVDDVVPVWASRLSERALRAAGVPVESLYPPGLSHGIDEAGIAAGAAALTRAFAV